MNPPCVVHPAQNRRPQKPVNLVQLSEDKIQDTRYKLTPPSEGLGFPSGIRTQLHVTTSLSAGGRPVICVQLSEGGY